MKRFQGAWDAMLIASIVLIAGLCAQSSQQAHADDEPEPNGPIVQISPDDNDEGNVAEFLNEQPRVQELTYWIGVRGRGVESVVLRTHLQLAEDMGVVVEEVVDDSPAAKAGLRKHDIVLRANGTAVHGMTVLQDMVRTGKDQPLKLGVIRLGKEEKIVVVPEKRPAQIAVSGESDLQDLLRGNDPLKHFLEQFHGKIPRGMRQIGPGIIMDDQRLDLNAMPSGVSVSVQRHNDGPAQVTVQRGDQTWKVTDDVESLQQLPHDIRPFVERMLRGQAGRVRWGGAPLDLEGELRMLLPPRLEDWAVGAGSEIAPDPMQKRLNERFGLDPMQKRMEKIEKQLEQLKHQLQDDSDLIEAQ